MTSALSLADYVEGFAQADQPWPTTVPNDEALGWWHMLPIQNGMEACWPYLSDALPQLLLPQKTRISGSDLYRRTVVGGQPRQAQSQPLEHPQELRIWIAEHPYGSMPVLATPWRKDFIWIVRALAHRGEPIAIDAGVHAQAISGLIHWGLIRELGPKTRARLIVLHDSPYGSVPAAELPIGLDEEAWIKASSTLRLEHELTHLATKCVLGEMRLNLLDELIADTMGMLAALGHYSADVFQLCLQGRWGTYVEQLSEDDAKAALAFCLLRAKELEDVLTAHLSPAADHRCLLPWLCRQRLDRPIQPLPSDEDLGEADCLN
jgi:hypothetical protein